MTPTERRRGQHLVAGIGVHVVLLRLHREILQPLRDRILLIRHLHLVADDAAGMVDPLTARHELVARVVPESIAHAAVPTRHVRTIEHRLVQSLPLRTRDLAHRPDRHDQIKVAHAPLVRVDIHRVRHHHTEALRLQPRHQHIRTLFGLMPIPSAPHHQHRLANRLLRCCLLLRHCLLLNRHPAPSPLFFSPLTHDTSLPNVNSGHSIL